MMKGAEMMNQHIIDNNEIFVHVLGESITNLLATVYGYYSGDFDEYNGLTIWLDTFDSERLLSMALYGESEHFTIYTEEEYFLLYYFHLLDYAGEETPCSDIHELVNRVVSEAAYTVLSRRLNDHETWPINEEEAQKRFVGIDAGLFWNIGQYGLYDVQTGLFYMPMFNPDETIDIEEVSQWPKWTYSAFTIDDIIAAFEAAREEDVDTTITNVQYIQWAKQDKASGNMSNMPTFISVLLEVGALNMPYECQASTVGIDEMIALLKEGECNGH
jgi:thiol-disulfide isomerase/thioredoxin